MLAASGSWVESQMSDEAIRLNLQVVKDIYPELHAELERLSPAHRSERIRTLATVGIVYLKLIETSGQDALT